MSTAEKQRLFEQMVLGDVPIDGGDMAVDARKVARPPSQIKKKQKKPLCSTL